MSSDPPLQPRVRQPVPLGICIGLIGFYGLMSFWAVSGKSSTYDEPLHALGAWMHLYEGDFRINFEDPPLWHYWATLLNGPRALTINKQDKNWLSMPENIYDQWSFTLQTLYRTPGNYGEAFVLRQRFMMVLAGMILCGVVALWSWRLGGPIAAVIATALVGLDPNLLGHGALVKNDVPLGLMMAGVFYLMWRVGQKLTWANGIGLAVMVAVAVNVKFSSLLFGPMLLVVLAIRVLVPGSWEVLSWNLSRLYQKLLAAAALVAAMSIVSFIGIWACYGFRFNPSPDPAIRLNTYRHKVELIQNVFQATYKPPVVPEMNPSLPIDQLIKRFTDQYNSFIAADAELHEALATAQIEPVTRNYMLQRLSQDAQMAQEAAALYNQANLFLPQNIPAPENRAENFNDQYNQIAQALEYGRARLYQIEHDLDPLNGSIRMFIHWARVGDTAPDGFIRLWNIAMQYKLLPSGYLHGVLFVHARSIIRSSFLLGDVSATGWWYYFPLAMLFKTPVATLFALAGAVAMAGWLLVKRIGGWRDWLWPAACLAVPVGMYLFSVMSANLNIGMRHVLCVYPLFYVAAGVLLVRALKQWPWIVRAHLYALGGILLIESLVAFPNYIAYFNFAVGGSRGGFKLLADSNLDWGQDLPRLKAWQDRNPDAPLVLAYFGIAEVGKRLNPDGSTSQFSDWTTLPTYYQLRFTPYGPGFSDLPATPNQARGSVVAISATELQGVYNRNAFAAYRDLRPLAVLGGTIYLFDLRN